MQTNSNRISKVGPFLRAVSFMVLLIGFVGCTPSLPPNDYYGVFTDDGYPVRLLLSNKDSKPSLTVIGFRGNDISIENVSFRNDTLRFRRADASSTYEGRYDTGTKSISGVWTGGNGIAYPLTLSPVLKDTIIGLNPRTTDAYDYIQPPDEDDGIEVCSLQTANLNAHMVDSLIRAIMKKKFGYVHSILIARNNCLALEEYFYGYKREMHFGIQSATKSMVSALTGIAIANGEIPGVETPICNYLPEYRGVLCNEQNRNIALHHVLSMSTGLKWDEVTFMYGDERNSAVIASNQPDELRFLLTQPRTDEKVFAYNSLNHAMMSRLLKETTGLDNVAEFNQRLIGPLGITDYDLGQPDDGIIGDIFLRPRDMLKFGLLYYNNGVWNGKQLVPRAWVKESTSPKIMLEKGFGYGYFWWTKEFLWKGKTVGSYFAWGFGGQYIFVVPELDLVVVFNGTNWSTDPTERYFDFLQNYIIPACG